MQQPTASGAVGSVVDDGQIDEKTMSYTQKIFSRNDTNGDGVLTPDEWKQMLMDPSAADADQDGRITLIEYALWQKARATR